MYSSPGNTFFLPYVEVVEKKSLVGKYFSLLAMVKTSRRSGTTPDLAKPSEAFQFKGRLTHDEVTFMCGYVKGSANKHTAGHYARRETFLEPLLSSGNLRLQNYQK